MSFADRIPGYRERIEAALERSLPPAGTHPARFHTAIRYAVLGRGKRLRPLLTYATGEWLGLPAEPLDAIAVAVELVHAYALAHDDLPALDDHPSRCAREATHVAFDEATAILVGDALQAHAYHVLAVDEALQSAPQAARQLVIDLAKASGSEGMAGGQAMEMGVTFRDRSAEMVEAIYALKTGKLLEAAVTMPCRLAQPGEATFAAARRFAAALGLGYQLGSELRDDTLAPDDKRERGPTEATLAARLGTSRARQRLAVLREEADAALAAVDGDTDGLRHIGSLVFALEA